MRTLRSPWRYSRREKQIEMKTRGIVKRDEEDEEEEEEENEDEGAAWRRVRV